MATFRSLMDEGKKEREERDGAFGQWKADPKPETLRRAVDDLDDVISSSLHRYVGPKSSPVLKQRARLLAAKALQTYDPEKGANVRTHVANQLRSLQRMAPGVIDPLPPPERFRRQQAEIRQAADVLSDRLGRDVTDEEIAELTQLPITRVSKVRNRMRARIPLSAYEETEEGDDESPELEASKRELYDDWTDAVYHDLGDLDRLIMMHRSGYRNADILSTQEIAERLGITPAAVSQRANRIQQKLDQFHAPPS